MELTITEKTVFVTGAGISVASGLRTYRDPEGIWADKNFQIKSHKNRYGNYLEDLQAKWLQLAEQADLAEPSLFHAVLAQTPARVITQNVDGLHTKAGSQDVLEVHGNIKNWRPLHVHRVDDLTSWRTANIGDRTRPDIVLFGEKLHHLKQAEQWLKEADCIVYAGTSGNVNPVAEWYTRNPMTVLIDPKPWGKFKHYEIMDTDTWAIKHTLESSV